MPFPSLTPDHVAALARVATALADARGDWWIIAGAAVALHGGHPVRVDDIDVLIAREDVPLIAGLPDMRRPDGDGDGRFKSEFYGTTDVGEVVIEWMAGFAVMVDERWRSVLPQSRTPVCIGGTTVYVPDRDGLTAMLRSFGRAKDLARIAILGG